MDTLTYHQMIGRAGRMGKDVAGESILICQKNERESAKILMSATLSEISSCLKSPARFHRAVLEIIASGAVAKVEDITLFGQCTLLACEGNLNDLETIDPIQNSVEFLIRNELIRLQKDDDSVRYVATSLAKACLSSSMPPDDGLALFIELEKARRCFVLQTELHLIYTVTPYSACNTWGNIDWGEYWAIWKVLCPADQRVGELVGVNERFISNAMVGRVGNSTERLMLHTRFFVALALRELVDEVPLNDVASKYRCNRGMLQSLQQSASTFAGMVCFFVIYLLPFDIRNIVGILKHIVGV